MSAAARDRLRRGLEKLALPLPAARFDALLRYLDLLRRWNRAFNLVGRRDPGAMVTRHLLDCLAVAPHLPPGRVLDAGTGAGLPGIPLALACPDNAFVLLDGSERKCRFLFQARLEAGLDNVLVERGRLEHYKNAMRIDIVICRALGPLDEVLGMAEHLMGPGRRLLAMKGRAPRREIAALAPRWRVRSCLPLEVPGLGAPRHLVEVAAADRPRERGR